MDRSIIKSVDISMADTHFQLMSHHTTQIMVPGTYVYARYPNGVRLRIRGDRGITRGGTTIDLSSLCLPFTDTTIEYDACLVHTDPYGNGSVLFELYTMGTLAHLTIRVIDIIDVTLPFRDRCALLVAKVPRPYRIGYYPVEDNIQLDQILTSKQIHHVEVTGIIVRRLDGLYSKGRYDRDAICMVKFRPR
jgi:hypothetical protein